MVCRSEVSNNASDLGGRFALDGEDPGTSREKYKACFVGQGH